MKNNLRIEFKFNNHRIGCGLYSDIKKYSDILNIVKDVALEFKGSNDIESIISKLNSYYNAKDGIVEATNHELDYVGGMAVYFTAVVDGFTPNGSLLFYDVGVWYKYSESFESVIIDLGTMDISLDLKSDNSVHKLKLLLLLNQHIPKDSNIKIICTNIPRGTFPGFSGSFKVDFNIDEIDNVIDIFKTIDDVIEDDGIRLKCIDVNFE